MENLAILVRMVILLLPVEAQKKLPPRHEDTKQDLLLKSFFVSLCLGGKIQSQDTKW
jgi:hypothetical protein